MTRRAFWTVTAFAAWTLFVWATRIDNVWGDDELSTAGRMGNTTLAATFVVVAVAVAVSAWRDRSNGFAPTTIRLVRGLAVWTAVVWLVRGTGILLEDRGVAFKVVHLALAVVSIALAVLATRVHGRRVHVPPSRLAAGDR